MSGPSEEAMDAARVFARPSDADSKDPWLFEQLTVADIANALDAFAAAAVQAERESCALIADRQIGAAECVRACFRS